MAWRKAGVAKAANNENENAGGRKYRRNKNISVAASA